jgi:hypothetical protein
MVLRLRRRIWKKETIPRIGGCGGKFEDMILILSNKWDLSVDFIVSELRSRDHPFLRLNTEDLVFNQIVTSLPNLRISLSLKKKSYDLTEAVKVVWYRRPGKPFDDIPQDEKPSPTIQQFVAEQWGIWIEALQLIPDVTWVNSPDRNNCMENKIRQLVLATELGFPIPDTIVSNDPNRIREHATKHSGVLVTKALYAPLIEEPDQDSFIFTNRIDVSELDGVENELQISPSIFQKCLSPKIDYRVTVIGDKVFPVKVEYKTEKDLPVDWRIVKDEINFTYTTIPQDVENKCRKYVESAGLIFGAIDLIEYGGDFYFVEINPNGEWGWLQKPHNIPIAQTLCDLLVSHDR